MGVELADFLADRDEPCPSCGYNLRGLKRPACPECGAGLTLRVNLTDPRLASFIGGVIALSVGAGFHGLVFAYFMFQLARGRVWGSEMPMILVLVLGGLGSIGGLIAWVRLWRQIRDRSRRFRWTLVAAGAIFSLGTAVLFFGLAG